MGRWHWRSHLQDFPLVGAQAPLVIEAGSYDFLRVDSHTALIDHEILGIAVIPDLVYDAVRLAMADSRIAAFFLSHGCSE